MSIKALLKVQLLANDVVVAESDSSMLWQSVLSAIEEDRPRAGAPSRRVVEQESPRQREMERTSNYPDDDSRAGFAHDLRIELKLLEAACGPLMESPYIHLDRHHWESLRKNTPERGPTAVPPVVLAATLLALWWRRAGQQGLPSVSDIKPVLDTIHLSAFNISRSLENCRWLQVRGKSVSLNPSKTSAAVALARAYCLQQPIEGERE